MNKKKRTTEGIFRNILDKHNNMPDDSIEFHFRVNGKDIQVFIDDVTEQIKQLILDEVIGEDDGGFEEIDLFGENGEKVTIITSSKTGGLRKQQLKKLERL